MTQLELPDHFCFPHVSCSIPYTRCNPYMDECLRACEEWGEGEEVIKEGARFLCWLIPEAEDLQKLILVCKFLGMMFAVDDCIGESPELAVDEPKLVEMLQQAALATTEESKYNYKPGELSQNYSQFALLEEATAELRRKMPGALYARLAKSMSEYFAGPRRRRRSAGHYSISSVDDYLRDRLEDGFLWGILCTVEFCLVEYNGRHERMMTDSWADPLLYELCRAASEHVCLVNDLFSFRKEYYCGKWDNNILAVLYRETRGQGGFQRAVDMCRDLIEEKDKELLRLRDQLLLREDLCDDLRKLAVNIPYVASGNLRYSVVTPRYNGAGNTLLKGEVYHGTLLMHPRATIVLPPYPGDAAALYPPSPRPSTKARAAAAIRPVPSIFRLRPECLPGQYYKSSSYNSPSLYRPPMAGFISTL